MCIKYLKNKIFSIKHIIIWPTVLKDLQDRKAYEFLGKYANYPKVTHFNLKSLTHRPVLCLFSTRRSIINFVYLSAVRSNLIFSTVCCLIGPN